LVDVAVISTQRNTSQRPCSPPSTTCIALHSPSPRLTRITLHATTQGGTYTSPSTGSVIWRDRLTDMIRSSSDHRCLAPPNPVPAVGVGSPFTRSVSIDVHVPLSAVSARRRIFPSSSIASRRTVHDVRSSHHGRPAYVFGLVVVRCWRSCCSRCERGGI